MSTWQIIVIVLIRASTSVDAKLFLFCISKTYFSYFTHSFLQNTHISLSILHIYSIKCSFFYIFYYFLTHGRSLSLTASLSLSDPTIVIITQPPSSRNLNLSNLSFVIFLFLILMVDQSRNPDPFKQKPKVDQTHSSRSQC